MMLSLSTKSCQFSLEHRETKLELRATSSLQLACPQYLGAASNTLLDTNSLVQLKPWISRGEGFCVNLRVLIDGTYSENDEQAIHLAETLGQILRDAELWNQLHLQATLSFPAFIEDATNAQYRDFVIHLGHSQSSGPVEKRTRIQREHRMASDSDVRPPEDVPCLGMQALKLTLDFCHIRGRHRRTAATRINRREAFPSPISPDQEKECLPQSNESRQAHVKATSKFDRDHSSTPSNITNDMILDQDSGTSSLPSFSKHASQSTEVSDVPLAVSIPRKPKRPRELFPAVSCKTPSPTSNLNLRSMVALTDAALRTIICDKPMRTALGIKVSSQGNSTKLEKLAPTLWSPGYLSAVAQRAQFLPIAANAICSIHGRTSFPIIKRKLAALASWSSSRPPGHPQIQDDSAILDLAVPHAIRKAAKAGLWKILQHGVYDPGAARRLKPLKLPDPTSPSASSMQNSEMLEEDNFPNLLDDDIPVLLDEEERGWLASQDSDISLFEYLDDEDAVIEEKDYEDKFIDLEAEGCWYDDGVDQEATDTIGGMMEDDFELQPDASNDDLFCPQILEHQQQSNEALTPQFHNGNMILEQESDTCGMIPRHQDADIILEQGFDFDSIPLEIRDGELMLL